MVAGIKNIKDLATPVSNNFPTAVGDIEVLAKIISVGVAFDVGNILQQLADVGLDLQASTKLSFEQ